MIKLHCEAVNAIQSGLFNLFKTTSVAVDWDDSDSDTLEALVSWSGINKANKRKLDEFKDDIEFAMQITEILNGYEIEVDYVFEGIGEDEYNGIIEGIKESGGDYFKEIMESIIEKYGVEA